jgi:integrase/recombinase XerD
MWFPANSLNTLASFGRSDSARLQDNRKYCDANKTCGLGVMKQAKTLDEREVKTAFACIATRRHGVRDRAIVAVSFYGGLRAHEIASLTVGCVRGADGAVVREFVLSRSQTKGKQGRKIFLSEKLRKEIVYYLSRTQLTDPSEPLFKTQKGNRFTANAMCHLFGDIYKQARIRGASSHSGRRTFITNLAGKGISVRVLAALAGHASISTTQRYIDVNDIQLRAAVELAAYT